MAYRSFCAERAPQLDPQIVRAPVATAATARLSRQERQVVLMSRADSLSSLRLPGRLSRAVKLLFGYSPRNRLASPRLEALRRFAVLLRARGEKIAAAERDRFMEAGFDPALIEEVQSLIQRQTGHVRSGGSWRSLLFGAIAVMALLYMARAAGRTMDDWRLGLVVAGLLFVTGAPIIAAFNGTHRPPR